MGILDFLKPKNNLENLSNDFKNTCLSLNINISSESEIDIFSEGELILDFYESTQGDFYDIMKVVSKNPIVGYIYHITDSFLADRYNLFIDFLHKLEEKDILPEKYKNYNLSVGDKMNTKDTMVFIYFYTLWEKNINKKANITKSEIENSIEKISNVFGY